METVRIIGDFHLSDITPRSWKIPYFDNCLFELREASKGVKNLIVLGDFFDKPTIPDAFKLRLVNELIDISNSGCKIWSIVGNHDIIGYNMSESVFERTSINLISSTSKAGGEYFNLITEPTVIGGITFVPFQGCRGSGLVEAPNNRSVLLAHAFYNNPIDEILNISKEDLVPLKYAVAALGHDHEPHADVKAGNTLVVRPGSFTRSSSHAFNLNRKPTYVDLVVSSTGKITVSHSEVSTAYPSGDIFREECFLKKTNTRVFESNLSLVFDVIAEKKRDESEFSLQSILVEVGADEKVIDYLRSIHRESGVKWS